jgi:5-methylcytosine-specific restriction endonuclease McrA
MGRKQENTPRSRVRAALRQLWLRSRERAAAIRRDKYTCVRCGVKQSKRKGFEQRVEVHHRKGRIGNWNKVIDLIFEELLCSPDNLETLCPNCHDKEGDKDAEG